MQAHWKGSQQRKVYQQRLEYLRNQAAIALRVLYVHIYMYIACKIIENIIIHVYMHEQSLQEILRKATTTQQKGKAT